MRARHFLYLFLCLPLFSACVTSRPPTRPPSNTQAESIEARVVDVTQNPGQSISAGNKTSPDLEEMRDQAIALRTRIVDLQLAELLSDEFATADVRYVQGAETYGKDDAISAEAYLAARNGYQDILDKGLPLLSSNWRERALVLSSAAQKEDADIEFPGLFPLMTAEYSGAVAHEAERDFDASMKGYAATCEMADILMKLCGASATRASIISRDFAKWDPSNWTLAEGKFAESRQFYADDRPRSSDAADEAALRYRRVVDTALGYYSSDRKGASETAMAKAQAMKAHVAAKELYDAAMALYEEAKADQASGNVADAGELYARAAETFENSCSIAENMMNRAHSELESLDGLILAAEAGY